MAKKYSFFRVDNGDMTLVSLDTGKTILIDCNIRVAADDPDDDTPDVARQLRERLNKDADGRYYVDVMILSHPDQDHCRGLENHFHLGAIADFPLNSDKIIVREMWSSPIVFRRHTTGHTLCSDAKYWNKEAKRRVNFFKTNGWSVENERVLVIGEDKDGKTDGLGSILKKVDETIYNVNGVYEPSFAARVIAPLPIGDEEEEEQLSKNDSSIILRFQTGAGNTRFLTGGDAEVGIWERVWARQKNSPDNLAYDLLLTPHHCSWHTLSWHSWSDYGEDAAVSEDAKNALGQAQYEAKLIASCKAICDGDSDPPCVRAEREYEEIAGEHDGEFLCTGDDGPEPLEFEVGENGLQKMEARAVTQSIVSRAFASIAAKLNFFDQQGHKQRPQWPVARIGNVQIIAKATRRGFRPTQIANDSHPLISGTTLEFEARPAGVMGGFKVYWQVVNTGREAENRRHLRGSIDEFQPTRGQITKIETARYRGTHTVECFIVQNGQCVASSGPFIINVA